MKRVYSVLLIVVSCLACSDDDVNKQDAAINHACKKCQTKPEDMTWLRTIMQESETNVGKATRIYVVDTSEGVIFVNQPLVMSCIACQGYFCDGTTVELVDNAELYMEMQNGAREQNVIYSSY